MPSTACSFGDGALVTPRPARRFAAPDATDLYGFGGNPDLESRGVAELSKPRYRQPLGERQSFSLTAFRNDIDDLIEFVVIDPDTFEGENRNVDEGAHRRASRPPGTTTASSGAARATATLQDPRDRTTDERLLRRARENYTAALARRFGGHEVGVDLLYAGERRDFGFPAQTVLPAYWLANLSAKVALAEHFTLLLRVENLFDEDYELASGFNTMGQSFFGALRYEFR